ncbi:unnamed protein product [Blepharisma stoltei]|uniref:DUF8019 domain-containing protein n=1 Tax=Blepharisma stoltei TaxID=1481888 RepID=A0AAU9K3H4_9CILI|nr:unnamed protein product [Blepharisma stoltei]
MLLKTVILISLFLAYGSDLCEMTLQGGICLFGGETVLMPNAVQDGLKGHWTFDDDSGLDSSGSQNHASKTVGAGPSYGGQGTSASITGSDYIEIPDSNGSLSSTLFSVTFWVFIGDSQNSEGLRWCPLLQKGNDQEDQVIYERVPAVYYDREDRQLKAYVSTDEDVKHPQGEYVISNARIPFNRWTHIGVVRTQSRIRLFVNGIKDAVNSTDGWTQTNSSPLYIGNTPSTLEDCPVSFYVDEVRYFNRELEEEEIEAESAGALGAIEAYYIRLGCINCVLSDAEESCPEDTHHLCTSIELHSAGYQVARAMGWTDWNSHIWVHDSEADSSSETGIAICCLNLG